MKRFLTILTVILLLVIAPAVTLAQTPEPTPTATPEPPPVDTGPVQDITTDFEDLPGHFGLGAVVALIVILARLLKLPDGWGGYAALGVGVFAYAASNILPETDRDTLFSALDHAARLLGVILGSQVTHVSLKYAGVDRLWKWRDGKGVD